MQPVPALNASDFTRHRSDIFDAAIQSPVGITKHRKPKFVLVSMDQHQQLARGARQFQMLDGMTDDLRALMIEGLERDLHPNDD